ncbi:MAG: dihydropteroate synthase [Candidatus Microthrix sp.]|nr:dihydropteroate synthase [Candidatus Microthrix sp.]
MTTAAARPHGSLLAHDDGPLIMGIVNANADSFSDPRATMGPEAVIAGATELVDAGADLLDIGGQTASPAVAEISIDEELTRVLPVIEALAAELPQVPLSVDTYRLEVAEAALQAGASVLNNIIGAQHAEFAALAVRHDALHVITHNPGAPRPSCSRTIVTATSSRTLASTFALSSTSSAACRAPVRPRSSIRASTWPKPRPRAWSSCDGPPSSMRWASRFSWRSPARM